MIQVFIKYRISADWNDNEDDQIWLKVNSIQLVFKLKCKAIFIWNNILNIGPNSSVGDSEYFCLNEWWHYWFGELKLTRLKTNKMMSNVCHVQFCTEFLTNYSYIHKCSRLWDKFNYNATASETISPSWWTRYVNTWKDNKPPTPSLQWTEIYLFPFRIAIMNR